MAILIPKVFHRIWLGRKPLPEEFVRWGETWLQFHPGWQMKLWTEENLPPPRYPDLVEQCVLYRHQSNIFRYEVLLREGGIYIDTDFECLKNLEELIEGASCFSAWEQDSKRAKHAVANGFFGAIPGHPFVAELMERLPEFFNTRELYNVGPGFFTIVVRGHPEVKLFPRSLFYPYLWNELHRRGEVFPDAYAVHHWSSKWHPPSFTPIKTLEQNANQ